MMDDKVQSGCPFRRARNNGSDQIEVKFKVALLLIFAASAMSSK